MCDIDYVIQTLLYSVREKADSFFFSMYSNDSMIMSARLHGVSPRDIWRFWLEVLTETWFEVPVPSSPKSVIDVIDEESTAVRV